MPSSANHATKTNKISLPTHNNFASFFRAGLDLKVYYSQLPAPKMALFQERTLPFLYKLVYIPLSYNDNLTATKASHSRYLSETFLEKLILAAASMALICIGFALAWFHSLNLPVLHSIKDYRPQQATLILDKNGKALDVLASEFRLLVPYDSLPPLLPQAFVSAEDGRFWNHEGVDAISIVRAAFNNLISGHRSQGGSTITQQVTRALLLDRKKTYSRKLTEAFLSYRLERVLSKKEILFIYLNEIYLGEGAYGVEAAALTYFDKHASQLNLAEITLLAGLPQSPSNYSPIKNFQAAKSRQRYVLNRLAEDQIITPEMAHDAFNQEIRLVNRWKRSLNGYFSQYVRAQLEQRYTRDEILRGGLQVSTTVDERLQEAAMRALLTGVEKVSRRQPSSATPQAALIALDTASGRIAAMIGGTDYMQNQYNRAVQSVRQPGSAFKPILFAAALEAGIPPETKIANDALTIALENGQSWKPRNFNDKYSGNISLREALIISSNVGAVRLLRLTGFSAVLSLTKVLGIQAPMQPDYTLALGSSPLSLTELTSAYTAFANDGLMHAPSAITSVRSKDGRVAPWPQTPLTQVLSHETASWMHKSLQLVVQQGTGRNAGGLIGASGKTGTTDNNVDAWFVGSAGDFTTGVWVGHDHNTSLGTGETGGQTAAPIWQTFMQEAVQ